MQRATRSRTRTRTEVWPAPSKGWIQSGNITEAPPDAAEVLDNFIPTAQGARLRGGITEYADLGAAVVRLFAYTSGATDLFGSTATRIYDVDRVSSGSNTFGDIEGLTSGEWSATQISTTGGQFLMAVNGVDFAHYWDGTDWNPINGAAVNELPFDGEVTAFDVGETVTGGTSGASATIVSIVKTSATAGTLKIGAVTSGPFQDNEALTSAGGEAVAAGANAVASSITITNVATTALAQVWLFKERFFFVEGGTTSAWYLPVESIGGAAVELDLGSVFRKGGSLLFGATWSLDSGAGLDDVCLFVSTEGEIAVYEGTDPSSASTWALVGVYDIGKPLDKHAFFKAGGDLAILTEDGIIPVSEALRKDRAALQAVAITYPIEDAWKDAIAGKSASSPVTATLWQDETQLLVGTPKTDENLKVSFVANARTGAWARITGWDVRCQAVANGQLYFGSSTGPVYAADQGGTDADMSFTAHYVPKFKTSLDWQSCNMAGLTYKAPTSLAFDMDAHSEYTVDPLLIPATVTFESGDVWGTGVWGTFIWGTDEATFSFTEWQTVNSNGYSLSPSVSITSNQTNKLNFEILATRLRVESGFAL